MNDILKVVGRRLLLLPFLVIGVVLLVFLLSELNPIDQASATLGESATQEQLDQYRLEHHLNDPLIVKFVCYLGDVIHGNFGTYGANNASVFDRLMQALPVTLQLTFMGLLIGLFFAIIFGVISAIYRDRLPDKIFRIVSIVFIATPSFWLAVLLILCFSTNLHILPASGPLPAITEDFGGWLSRMILPAIAIAMPLCGSMTRIIRTSMVEELDKDYVTTAVGSGIPFRTVVSKNVFRNALISPVTVLGVKIGYMIGGAVVVEVIFGLPGMGMAIYIGVSTNYVLLIQGVVLIVAVTFIIINTIVDLLYIAIDPRIRTV